MAKINDNKTNSDIEVTTNAYITKSKYEQFKGAGSLIVQVDYAQIFSMHQCGRSGHDLAVGYPRCCIRLLQEKSSVVVKTCDHCGFCKLRSGNKNENPYIDDSLRIEILFSGFRAGV